MKNKSNLGFNVSQRGETTVVNVDGQVFNVKKASRMVWQVLKGKRLLTEVCSFQDALNTCNYMVTPNRTL